MDSDFIKSLPSHPGKEFEIKKILDRLRGVNTSFSNNNNNNNNDNNNSNLFGPGGKPPSLPTIEDFLDGGPRPPQLLPPSPPSFNLFSSNEPVFPPPPTNDFNVNASVKAPPPNISTRGKGNDLFGSQAASAVRENKTKTQKEVDEFLYKRPEAMLDLVLGDELTNALGTDGQIFLIKMLL